MTPYDEGVGLEGVPRNTHLYLRSPQLLCGEVLGIGGGFRVVSILSNNIE